jgi:hypothetical protein
MRTTYGKAINGNPSHIYIHISLGMEKYPILQDQLTIKETPEKTTSACSGSHPFLLLSQGLQAM